MAIAIPVLVPFQNGSGERAPRLARPGQPRSPVPDEFYLYEIQSQLSLYAVHITHQSRVRPRRLSFELQTSAHKSDVLI